MNDKKNVLIIIMLITIVVMAVGYAALGETLAIAGNNHSAPEWSVQISSVTADELVGATVNLAKKQSNLAAIFDVDLAYPGAYAVFEVEVVNKGLVDAKFQGFSDLNAKNAEMPDYITYTVSGITKDSVLPAGKNNSQKAIVTVAWDKDMPSDSEQTSSKVATIAFDYIKVK